MVEVTFISKWGMYVAGETAGFDAKTAGELVKAKVANLTNKKDAEEHGIDGTQRLPRDVPDPPTREQAIEADIPEAMADEYVALMTDSLALMAAGATEEEVEEAFKEKIEDFGDRCDEEHRRIGREKAEAVKLEADKLTEEERAAAQKIEDEKAEAEKKEADEKAAAEALEADKLAEEKKNKGKGRRGR